ncbi:MAG: RNA-binding protein [Methanomicrobiales archaeon]|nr:RNA-binding protein [Methanomicrobiales archaeon]MDI6876725.1 RNA-binding protein [Methanomicrobiales archaeon]
MAAITLKKRHPIRKGEIASLQTRLAEQIGESADLFRSDTVEVAETDSPFRLYLIGRRPLLMEYGGWVFPTLRGAIEHPFPQRHLIVDTGAIPFVIKGADIMRPGIVSFTEDIRAGAPVVVAEERHDKPLAIGVALYDSSEMQRQEKGKMARNIHYVGDDLWNLEI